MFEVKAGTPKPILFRECWNENGFYMDLDLEARFAGKCEISDYDHSRYANDEEVSLFIKSNCIPLFSLAGSVLRLIRELHSFYQDS